MEDVFLPPFPSSEFGFSVSVVVQESYDWFSLVALIVKVWIGLKDSGVSFIAAFIGIVCIEHQMDS